MNGILAIFGIWTIVLVILEAATILEEAQGSRVEDKVRPSLPDSLVVTQVHLSYSPYALVSVARTWQLNKGLRRGHDSMKGPP